MENPGHVTFLLRDSYHEACTTPGGGGLSEGEDIMIGKREDKLLVSLRMRSHL